MLVVGMPLSKFTENIRTPEKDNKSNIMKFLEASHKFVAIKQTLNAEKDNFYILGKLFPVFFFYPVCSSSIPLNDWMAVFDDRSPDYQLWILAPGCGERRAGLQLHSAL